MKPFKPPTVVLRTPSNSQQFPTEPPAKKRRVNSQSSSDDEVGAISAAAKVLQKSRPPPNLTAPARRPPLQAKSVNPIARNEQNREDTYEAHFTVLWRKFTTKKNKTWDGDGLLKVTDNYAVLQDITGRELGRTTCKNALLVGSQLSVGSREVEIDAMISKQEFQAHRQASAATKKIVEQSAPARTKGFGESTLKAQAKSGQSSALHKDQPLPVNAPARPLKAGFKAPMLNNTVQAPNQNSRVPIPRHDPTAPGALVMPRPRSAPKGRHLVDVVVDPILSRTLREHQRAGVSFLYECIMGLKEYNGEGAILADEMGLGKTLQTIALLWTLLKQNPIYEDPPVVKKALIVCPVTLIDNWRAEIRKWLGKERVGVFVADGDKSKRTRLTDFTVGKSYSVMIVGYEKLRTIANELSEMPGGIDIVIADEGHRMKTTQNKSAQAIKLLNTQRRIILSGTPFQNDFAEFWSVIDLVNPGLLNKYSVFKRDFENPILKSKQPGASQDEVTKGAARSEELTNITNMFILRRTQDVMAKYLPPKTEYVVFCKPTKSQADVYRRIIGSSTFSAAMGSGNPLELINVLKKVCNSPSLLLRKDGNGEEAVKSDLIEAIPHSLLRTPGASGKLQVLDSLLHQIRTTTNEKVVLVSGYTSTLDVLQQLVASLGYKHLRLDGSTPASKRLELVNLFNRKPKHDTTQSGAYGGIMDEPFVFLLSAKAGGIGLNLVGASRLILFDLDWNPATDLQAMARIHRDKQLRPCFIYRFLTQGALDEKIFQRQVAKTGLADSVVDGKNGVPGFSYAELRDLFTLDEREHGCLTHDLLGCKCGATGLPPLQYGDTKDPEISNNDLATLSAGFSSVSDDDKKVPSTADAVVEVVDMQDSDDDILLRNSKKSLFTTGSKVHMASQESESRRHVTGSGDTAGRPTILSLMQYSHLDPSLLVHVGNGLQQNLVLHSNDIDDVDVSSDDLLVDAIEDKCLRAVLREDGRRVGFVMAKVNSFTD